MKNEASSKVLVRFNSSFGSDTYMVVARHGEYVAVQAVTPCMYEFQLVKASDLWVLGEPGNPSLAAFLK